MAQPVNAAVVTQMIEDIGLDSTRALAALFVEEARARVTRMAAMSDSGNIGDDLDPLCFEAHALKSTTLTYGMQSMADNARDLEIASRENNAENATSLLREILSQAADDFEAFEAHIANLS